jgi:hypothetical protein
MQHEINNRSIMQSILPPVGPSIHQSMHERIDWAELQGPNSDAHQDSGHDSA